MQISLDNSLIAAGGTVLGAAITAIVPYMLARSKESKENKRFHASVRMPAAIGVWVGSGKDFYTDNGSPFVEFQLKLELQAQANRMTGIGRLNETQSLLSVEGGFYSDSYLQFAYKSVDPTRMQMGVIVFDLCAEGRTLKGQYAGFSPTRKIFVAGSVFLTKITLDRA